MLSLKSGLLVGTFAAIAVAVGCGASGTVDEGDPTMGQSPTDPAAKDSGAAPSKTIKSPNKDGGGTSSSSSSGDDSTGDDDDDWLADAGAGSSSSSSGGIDAGVDSGPPAPEAGESCSTQDALFNRTCGHCGKQQAICTTNRTGTLKVSDYGPCGGESGVCTAGESLACGNCGTKVCGNTCGWGSCKNEGVCKPGVLTHDTAGCPTAGTYREKQCADTCSFGGFSACKEPGLTVPAPGATVMDQWELTTAMVGKRPSACKKSTFLSAATVFFVPLTNPTSADVTVQIWHSAVNKVGLDTVVATYATKPSTDDDFKACSTEPQDSCSQLQDICTADGGSGFGGVDNVKVPANSTIWIANIGWSSTTAGKFVLNVKTK